MFRFQQMLFPSKPEDFSDFCRRGFHDCFNYLQRNGYIKKSKLKRRLTFSEEWHEAQLRRIKDKKNQVVRKTIEASVTEHKPFADTLKSTQKGF